jgi:single-stranded DNA-binding protein
MIYWLNSKMNTKKMNLNNNLKRVMYMKKMIITGNLDHDPEWYTDKNYNQYATFSVVVRVGSKDNPKTDCVHINCNGRLSVIVRLYLKKGSKVLIEGYPTVEASINKENEAVASLHLFANSLEILKRDYELLPSDSAVA